MKKILIFSLLICLVCSLLVFASCEDTPPDGTETGTQEEVTTAKEEVTTEEVTTGGDEGDDPTDSGEGDTSGSDDPVVEPGMTPGTDADGGSYNRPTPIL